jgi:predicted heme/steroid binding protein
MDKSDSQMYHREMRARGKRDARIACDLTFVVAIVFCFTCLLTGTAAARPQFAQFTGNPCSACHISPQGGGPLKPEGEEFKGKLKDLDIPMDPNLRISTGQRLMHLVLYLIHIPFGVAWAGLFLYTFIPAWRRRNLVIFPKSYIRQIMYGAIVVLVTGPLMVVMKMKMVPGLFTTRFGLLLLVKIAAVLALLTATAALLWHIMAVLAIRYKRLAQSLDAGAELELTSDDLLLFSGQDKRKALVAVDGRVYEVTGRNLWRGGIHPGGHHAGQDLTNAFGGAPHGKEVFERVTPVGRVVQPDSHKRRGPMSWAVILGAVASGMIFLVVALWRW